MTKDNIYSQPMSKVSDFKFDEKVAEVFEDMLQRSIPNYAPLVSMLRVMAERCVTPGSNVYDLGCSLGASAISMASGIQKPGCRVFAIDNSEPMIKRCQQKIDEAGLNTPVIPVCADIRDVEIADASMVVLNFTLQFLPLNSRDAMLKRIYSGMRHGALLVLSEKITIDDVAANALVSDLHAIWKKDNGYSDLEISQKRAAIENVLIPETPLAHHERILRCGFRHCAQWFQCFNFVSMLAFK